MLSNLLLLSYFLVLSQAQNDCSKYFYYGNENGEVQGLLTILPDTTKEHKVRVQLTIPVQISVSCFRNMFRIIF